MLHEQRYRNWNITIFKNAECWKNYQEILEDQIYSNWFWIKHQPEEDEKEEHIHIVIQFRDGKTFTRMKKMFEGAHIEETKYIISSIKYLAHKTKESEKKTQYKIEEIKTNDQHQLEIAFGSGVEYPELTYEDLISRIRNWEIINELDVLAIYGIKQYQRYRFTIQDIFNCNNLDRQNAYEMRKLEEGVKNENKKIN